MSGETATEGGFKQCPVEWHILNKPLFETVTDRMKQGTALQNFYEAEIEFIGELKERDRALKKFDKIPSTDKN